MLASDNTEKAKPTLMREADITIGQLLGALAAHSDKPLIFFQGGSPLKPGYHVTEVKAGSFAALDCGANPESWTEIFIQLWDVDEGERVHMRAGKFAAIICKVADHVLLDQSAKLTFEVSDGVRPIQLHCASHPVVVGAEVHVELLPRAASCKPRDRWLQEQKASTCCAPTAVSKTCCG